MTRIPAKTFAWLIVVSTTFALGWMLRPSPTTEKAPSSVEARLVGKSNESRVTMAPKARSQTGTRAAFGESPAGSRLQSRRPLSPGEIERLGEQFRISLDPIERRLSFAKMLAGLTPENALEMRKQIEHLPAESAEFREFHFAWGKIAGTDAVMFGADTPKPDMAPALAGWTSVDPDAALNWMSNLDMANDPDFAALLRERGIPEAELRNYLERGLVRGLASVSTARATDYVFGLAEAGDPRARSMLEMVTGTVVRTNGPGEASVWASNLPPGRMQSYAMQRAVETWANTDALATLVFAQTLDYDTGRGPALSAAYGRQGAGTGGGDPLAASQYLREMPESRDRDFAINGYSAGLAGRDPEAAVIWAQDISNPGLRDIAVIRAARVWNRIDSQAATAWATSSNLPPATQQAILSPRKEDSR